MTKGLKALVGVVLVFSLLISGVGYASLTDTLSVTGTASAEAAKGIYVSSVGATDLLKNVVYNTPSEPTLITATTEKLDETVSHSVTFSVTVVNNTNEDYMFYGINYTVRDATAFDYKVDVTYANGDAYTAARNGDSENRIDAIEGAIIAKGTSHELLVTISRTGGINKEGDVGFILNYEPVSSFVNWVRTTYIVTFMDGTNPVNVTAVNIPSGATASGNKIEVPFNNALNVSKGNVDPTSIPSDQTFSGWLDSTGTTINSIDSSNTADIVLYPSWSVKQTYTITFIGEYAKSDEASGNTPGDDEIVHTQTFIPGSTTTLTDDGLRALEAHLTKHNSDPDRLYTASWPSYDLTQEKNITIRLDWTYTGTANLVPVPDEEDPTHYEVGVMDEANGKKDIIIPSEVNGKPVTGINANAFASYNDLTNLYIPSSITSIGTDSFADEEAASGLGGLLGQKKYETIQIFYEGTMDDWQNKVTKDEGWDRYVGQNSVIKCSDGVLKLTSRNSQNVAKVWTPYTKDQFVSPDATDWETFDTWEEFCTVIWDQDETGHFVWP